MDRRTGRRQKRISKKQEDRTAQEVGGRTQANSGATRFGGGADVRGGDDTRIECKYTEKPAYSLKLAELEKVRKQAIKTLEAPVLQIAFCDRLGRFDRYAVIPWQHSYGTGYLIETKAKSVKLDQQYLRSTLTGKSRLCVTFWEGERSKLFEVLHWDDYLERGEEWAV